MGEGEGNVTVGMSLCFHLASCGVSDMWSIDVFSKLPTWGVGSVSFMQDVLFI